MQLMMLLCILEWIIATVYRIPTIERLISEEEYYYLALGVAGIPAPIFLYVATLLLGAKNTLRPVSTHLT